MLASAIRLQSRGYSIPFRHDVELRETSRWKRCRQWCRLRLLHDITKYFINHDDLQIVDGVGCRYIEFG